MNRPAPEGGRHAVIGTAGHVDHGKTALVLALTGQDTDRLPEEKARGISIDLGFASLVLPSGKVAGVVDVPGHERFIRNMVAGATGIDCVLLVVAVDAGVMPQTLEHLEILRHLGVARGVVCLTKADLVEPEWLELVDAEVRAVLAGTFLADAPVIPASSVTREGLPALTAAIDAELERLPGKDASQPARLPIDRVFSAPGFGTIATGTLVAGRIARDMTMELLPAGREVRVRGLEVYGRECAQAVAGQRVAVNVAGVDRAGVERGDTLCAPGAYRLSSLVGVRLSLTPAVRGEREPGLRDAAPVHLHVGTSEVVARVLLLDGGGDAPRRLAAGSSARVVLRTQRPLVLARGDRFIVRSYSPVTTIGGGVVIEPDLLAACPRARTRARMGAHLGEVEVGRPEDHLARALAALGGRPGAIAELARAAGVSDPDVAARSMAALAAGGVAIPLAGGGLWADRVGLGKLIGETRSYLDAYYRTHRYGPGAGREDMRSRVFGGLEARRYGALLEYLESAGVIRVRKDYVSAADDGSPRATAALRIWDLLEGKLRDAGVSPPEAAALSAATDLAAGDVEDALAALTARGCAIRLVGLPFHRDVVARAREVVAGHFAAGHAELSVAAFRDLIGATRKYALPLLERFDRTGVTARRGETRVAGPACGAAEKGPEAMEEEPELE